MPDSKLTLEFFKETFDSIRVSENDYDLPFMKVAALLIRFTVEDVKLQSKNALGYEMLAQDESILMSHASSEGGDGSFYCFKDSDRNFILTKFSTVEQVQSAVKKISLHKLTSLQKTFFSFILDPQQSIDSFDTSQLAQLFQVSKWLKGTPCSLIDETEIIYRLQQLELLEPFVKLTRNFKGRSKELNDLSDYVDWLPKTSFTGTTKQFIFNVISWNEKPPLMITGLGGIGKSTLLAKFIVDQLKGKNARKLPFIYLDFDRPGLSIANPMMLIVSALKQLELQFPDLRNDFISIQRLIKEKYQNNFSSNSSRSSDRDETFDFYRQNPRYSEMISRLNVPILVVLDSFEEVEYRAKEYEIDTLFDLLRQISELLPRLRVVFAGRSELSQNVFRAQLLPLGNFDNLAADAYLESLGVDNAKLREFIRNKLSGNPLTLQLAADLVKNGGYNQKDFDEIKTTAFFVALDEKRIQEQLVKRNLDHIHDPLVRKIAVPGILIRKITPDVIQGVLAEPCGLGSITIQEATDIFKNLKRETFLFTQLGDNISFRQDLRLALHDLIINDPKYRAKDIHNLAVQFYENKTEPEDQAEYIYHRLKRGDDPKFLDQYYDPSVSLYLESSLLEFPANAQMRLSRRTGGRISKTVLKNSGTVEWELHMQDRIKECLKNGDEKTLQAMALTLHDRKERSVDSPLSYFEALLYFRVGEMKKALKIIETRRFAGYKKIEVSRFKILRAKIQEYELDFESSFDTLKKIHLNFLEESNREEINAVALEYTLAIKRVARRLRKPFQLKGLDASYLLEQDDAWIKELAPPPYRYILSKRLFTTLNQDLNWLDNRYFTQNDFKRQFKKICSEVGHIRELETTLRSSHDLYLKDVTDPGALKILIFEFILLLEVDGWDAAERLGFSKQSTGQLRKIELKAPAYRANQSSVLFSKIKRNRSQQLFVMDNAILACSERVNLTVMEDVINGLFLGQCVANKKTSKSDYSRWGQSLSETMMQIGFETQNSDHVEIKTEARSQPANKILSILFQVFGPVEADLFEKIVTFLNSDYPEFRLFEKNSYEKGVFNFLIAYVKDNTQLDLVNFNITSKFDALMPMINDVPSRLTYSVSRLKLNFDIYSLVRNEVKNKIIGIRDNYVSSFDLNPPV
jgi:hypothetical protein